MAEGCGSLVLVEQEQMPEALAVKAVEQHQQ